MRISDWSSDVCSSDLETDGQPYQTTPAHQGGRSGDFLLSLSFPLTHRIVMPIMAEHRWLYPIDWPELSRAIRFGRANGRCEHGSVANSDTVSKFGPMYCQVDRKGGVKGRSVSVRVDFVGGRLIK